MREIIKDYYVGKALKYLRDMGHNVDIHIYRPDNRNRYQIVKVKENGAIIPITPYYLKHELEIWAKGFVNAFDIINGVTPII